MTLFPKLPLVNENSERESNPMLQSLHLYLSGSAFLARFLDANKQSFRVKPVFKSREYASNSYTINKFITLFGVKVTVLF